MPLAPKSLMTSSTGAPILRSRRCGGLKISDLIVDGVSLRTTYRSDVASVIQNNGGKVANLIDALRQKTGSQ